MRDLRNVFAKLCREKFSFLVREFGCRLVSTKTEAGVDSVIYQNETTAVGIYYEVRDSAVWVVLMRLFKGRRLPYDGSYAHGLGQLLRLRAPARTLAEIAHTEEEMEQALSEDASALRDYATDVLRGDFSVFSELEKLTTERRGEPEERPSGDSSASG